MFLKNCFVFSMKRMRLTSQWRSASLGMVFSLPFGGGEGCLCLGGEGGVRGVFVSGVGVGGQFGQLFLVLVVVLYLGLFLFAFCFVLAGNCVFFY